MLQGEAWREETSLHCRTHYEAPCPARERKKDQIHAREREREKLHMYSHSPQEVPCILLSATCQIPPQCCFVGSLMHFDPTQSNIRSMHAKNSISFYFHSCMYSFWPGFDHLVCLLSNSDHSTLLQPSLTSMKLKKHYQ